MGLQHGKIRFTPLEDFPNLIEEDVQRPKEQSWMSLLPLAKVMGRPGCVASRETSLSASRVHRRVACDRSPVRSS